MSEKQTENKKSKYYFIGGAILILIAIILLLVSCSRGYKVELKIGNSTYYQGSIKKGDTLDKVEAPTMEGYTFDGWYDGNEKVDLNTPIDEDMVLVAKFSKNTYKVMFILDNGKEDIEKTVEYGEKVEEPTAPTKKGYTFAGWYYKENQFDFNTEIKSDLNITAIWRKKNEEKPIVTTTYTVEHYLMGLDGEYDKVEKEETFTAEVGSTVKPKTKDYKGFKSPKAKKYEVEENDELVVKYYYERNKYTLTITGDKGIKGIIGNGTYYYGEAIIVNVELKDGYNFVEYSNGSKEQTITYVMEDTNATIGAKTEANSYSIEYNLNGGETAKPLPSSYTIEDTIVLERPIREGYTFDYFTVNGEKIVGNTIKPNTYLGEITIEVHYKANTDTPYKVEHYLKDIEGESYTLKETDYLEGTTDETVIPSVKEYDGFTSPSEEEVTILPNGEATLKYYYERNKYSLTIYNKTLVEKIPVNHYDLGINGTIYNEDANKSITILDIYYEQDLNIEIKPKEGAHFKSWKENEVLTDELENASISVSMPSKDLKLEFALETDQYTITYNSNNGLNKGIQKEYTYFFTSDDAFTLEENTFTYYGYHFLGWDRDSEATTPEFPQDNLQVTENLKDGDTLYAIWEVNDNTVQYRWNNKHHNELDNYQFVAEQNFGELLSQPENNPEITGYTFLGWYKDKEGTEEWQFESEPMPNNRLILYAKWEANETPYTIEFYYMDTNGNYISEEEIKEAEGNLDSIQDKYKRETKTGLTDSEIDFTPEEAKEGFKTAVLKESATGDVIDTKVTISGDGSTVLKYFYEREKYGINVIKDNDNRIESVTFEPSKTEYYFGESVSVTIKANDGYHITKYNETTVSNDSNSVTFDYTITTSNTITVTSEGHTFKVNYLDEDGSASSIEESSFTYGGNTSVADRKIAKDNHTLTIKDYERNYTGNKDKTVTFTTEFIGWATTKNATVAEYTDDLSSYIPQKCNEELTLYAVYKKTQFNLEKPTENPGYKFKGFKDGNDTIQPSDNYTIDSDKELKTEWELITYTITYNDATECTNCEQMKSYNVESDFDLPTLQKTGYTFNGWTVTAKDDGIGNITKNSTITHINKGNTGNLTLTPKWTVHTYSVTYKDKSGVSHTASCTYDQDCVLTDIKPITIKYHDYIKDIDKTDPIKQVQELPIIKSCRENEDCQEIQTADNQYYVNNITDKNNETIDLKIVYGGYKLPEVKRDNYVFGGWGLNKPKTNGVISDEELETLEILGYQTLDGDSATFDGEYAYATEYELTDNQILHAVWWEIPYVEKVSFNFKDTMDPETGRVVATSEIEPSLNHADGFYVKIPNNPAYFVDVFSLNVVTSTAVKLNTKAIPDEDYFDLYHNGKGLPIEFLTHIDLPFENKSGDHKTYSTSLPDETEDPIIKLIKQFLKGGQMNQMFAAPTFLYILMGVGGGGATLGGGATVYKNIGVADKFACNGLACSEHYISTGVDLFGDSYVFVATEEAMEDSYTVKYMIGDEEVYSIELPRGAKIPEISTDELTVYEFDPETGMRGDEIAKYNVSDWSYSSSYADGENRTITIEGIGTKQISLEGIKIDMTATINEPSIEKEEEPTISGE